MRHRQVLIAGLFVLSIGFPSPASAAWPFHAASGVLLGYGQSYVRNGADAVHRGVDIGAPAASSVYAPAAGEVSFAGLVPGESGQVFAVSVKTCEGLTVTCLPFDSVAVAAGDDIPVGSLLGALAVDGDPSSSESHVHVSVRREQTYLDPTSVLGQVEESGDEETAVTGSQPQVAVTDEAVPSDEPAPLSEVVASGAVSPVIDVLGEAPAVAMTPEHANAPSTHNALGSQDTGVEGSVVPQAPLAGAGKTTLDASLPAAKVQLTNDPGKLAHAWRPTMRDVSSQTAVSSGVWRALGRLARSGDSRRSALVAAGGCLLAVVGLWPLWRKGSSPAFSYGVRPTLDDVAAAVGR